jgi:NodT family efflux transporter outer membrane factor (OMF) lipoprotein
MIPAPGASETAQHLVLGKQIAGEWWGLFHSRSLDTVVQRAITDNRSLAAAKATLAQSREVVNEALGVLYPTIDLHASVERERIRFGSGNVSAPLNLYTIGPAVSYPLDLFGGARRYLEQQEALARYQNYQLAAAYLTLTSNVVTEAINLAAARAEIKATKEIIASDQKNVDLVRIELKAGRVAETDFLTAISQLASDRTLLPPFLQQESLARHALSTLVGETPEGWSPPDFDLKAFALPQSLPVSLPSSLVRQRPDILSAQAELHAASAAIGVATAELYPQLTLSASLSQDALTPGNLFSGASTVWSIASDLAAPLFHGGSLEAQRRAAVDAYRAALATYQQTVLQAFQQVADVLQALAHDAELLRAEHRALSSAKISLALTRESYAAGRTSIINLLDAERLYQQALLGYLKAESQRYADTVQLFAAMGGGWWHKIPVTKSVNLCSFCAQLMPTSASQ